MGRQIRIVHHTGYRYSGLVSASHNEARMTPRSNREQNVLATMVDISPTAWSHSYADYWGTAVTAFEVSQPHNRLDLTATSTVDVSGRQSEGPGVTWEELGDPDFRDSRCEMLDVREHVAPSEELRLLAVELARDCATPAEAVKEILRAVRAHVEYTPGSTLVSTRATQVWESAAGVCQDIVHVSLGALRSAGIPCRYVSGYLMPSDDPVVGASYVGESHAWLQYWDGAWVGFDPTNQTSPDDFHVEVAHGRDYFDVPPLKGVFSGVADQELFVEVEMKLLA
ncbi:MAG: transglutaminase family protein [Propionibacteriaceae bacterium]|jgi:transglutaminase-like putative cysteine protease|nr:transglutaminase family protein [Propionibacteriaceae bacterium]